MNDLPFKATAVVTGLAIAGEAVALLIGMHFLSEAENPWITLKNDLFLALDVGVGLGLVYLALAHRGVAWSYILYVLVGFGLLTHGYREWEYLAGAGNAFCANPPLFAVNTLKLAGLVTTLILGWGLGPTQGS
jgi:hypothetical protein